MTPPIKTIQHHTSRRNDSPVEYMDSLQHKRLTTDHHTFSIFKHLKPDKKQCNKVETPLRSQPIIDEEPSVEHVINIQREQVSQSVAYQPSADNANQTTTIKSSGQNTFQPRHNPIRRDSVKLDRSTSKLLQYHMSNNNLLGKATRKGFTGVELISGTLRNAQAWGWSDSEAEEADGEEANKLTL